MAPNPFVDPILPLSEPNSSSRSSTSTGDDKSGIFMVSEKHLQQTDERNIISIPDAEERYVFEAPSPNFWEKLSYNYVEEFISEWTPFVLVTCYFVVSTCIYLVCTSELIAVFWFIYLLTNSYIAGSTVLEAVMSITPCRQAREALQSVEDNDWVFPTPDKDVLVLDLLIVAYLPNEKDIVMDRIDYATNKIIYPRDKIRITLVYNTPKPIEPLETQLRDLEAKTPHLRIIKVPGSTSKADNLNYYFSLDTGCDVTAIFDCDHYPQPYAPRFAIEAHMADPEVRIVQGRCIILNSKASWLAGMIAVEFDKIYAVSHPGRAATWNFGLFTGSNGYWNTKLLREHGMDGEMLTEDIDSALRAAAKRCKCVHDMNVISYELAPTKFMQFWNQRLRWAQGWAQASVKHFPMVFNKTEAGQWGKTERFGTFSLLGVRELSYYLVTQYMCLVLSIVITDFPKTGNEFVKFIFFQYPVAWWMFIMSAASLLVTLWITNRVKSEFISRRMIIEFSIVFAPYLVLSAIIGLWGHARQVNRYTKWNPTART